MDYFQHQLDTSYLVGDGELADPGSDQPRVKGCYVGLSQLHHYSPRTPSNSPPRLRKPVRYADSDSEQEGGLADLSSDSDSFLDPTVQPGQLSSTDQDDSDGPLASFPKILLGRRPALKVLNNLGQQSSTGSCVVYLCLP